MEHDSVALGIEAGAHPAARPAHDVPEEAHAFGLQARDQGVQIVDLEGDGAAGGGARRVGGGVGDGQAAALGQVVLDPVHAPLGAGEAGSEPEQALVEPTGALHVGHRVHRERDLLQHPASRASGG